MLISRSGLLIVCLIGIEMILLVHIVRPQTSPPSAQTLGPARWIDGVFAFDGGPLTAGPASDQIDYTLDPAFERFFIHVPVDGDRSKPWGLIVFIAPHDRPASVPDGWAGVLASRHILYVAPMNAGNGHSPSRRLGLGIIAAQEMMRRYPVDSSRVYIAGFSGGARMASEAAFFRSDLFSGTIQSCGSDFIAPVPRVSATEPNNSLAPYGVFAATLDERQRAHHVRFTIITGDGDFRHGNLLDIYRFGFSRYGYQARLFDIAGMQHTVADAASLAAAIDFIEAAKVPKSQHR